MGGVTGGYNDQRNWMRSDDCGDLVAHCGVGRGDDHDTLSGHAGTNYVNLAPLM
jgi:hypothetical protein